MNYCGPGGSGTPTNATDGFCAAHDLCFQNAGAKWYNNFFGTGGAAMQAAIQACNVQLCSDLSWVDQGESPSVERLLVEAAFGCRP